jgi:hypothetical protein
MKFFLFLFGILLSSVASSDVYRCVDDNGKTSYSDTECKGDKNRIDILEHKINASSLKDKVNPDENKLKVLYTGKTTGRNSRFLKVSIYEETESYMIFFVEGYYNGPSNGKVEFRVMPNVHWGSQSFSTSEKGVSSGYARVGFRSTEKGSDVSDIITLQLWYYSPYNKASVLETKVIPYKKKWVKDI